MFDCLTKYIPTFDENKHFTYGGIKSNSLDFIEEARKFSELPITDPKEPVVFK